MPFDPISFVRKYGSEDSAKRYGGSIAVKEEDNTPADSNVAYGEIQNTSAVPPQLSKWDASIDKAAKKYNLPKELFYASMSVENNMGDPEALGPVIENPKSSHYGDHAVGLFQIMPKTAAALNAKTGEMRDPADPDGGADLYAQHIREGLDRYNGDVRSAILDYFGGPGAVAKAQMGETVSDSNMDSNSYAQKVLDRFSELKGGGAVSSISSQSVQDGGGDEVGVGDFDPEVFVREQLGREPRTESSIGKVVDATKDAAGNLAQSARGFAGAVPSAINQIVTVPIRALGAVGAAYNEFQAGRISPEDFKTALAEGWAGDRDGLTKLANAIDEQGAQFKETVSGKIDPEKEPGRYAANRAGQIAAEALSAVIPGLGVSKALSPLEREAAALRKSGIGDHTDLDNLAKDTPSDAGAVSAGKDVDVKDLSKFTDVKARNEDLLSEVTTPAKKEKLDRLLNDHLLGDYGVTKFGQIDDIQRDLNDTNTPYTLELADGGNLGGLNKKYGDVHEEANRDIRTVWGEIYANEVVKNGGVIGRDQGDEFQVLWPGKTKDEVAVIRKGIEDKIRGKVQELGLSELPHRKYDNLPTGALHTAYGLVEVGPGKEVEFGKFGDAKRLADIRMSAMKEEDLAVARDKKSEYTNNTQYTGGGNEPRKIESAIGSQGERNIRGSSDAYSINQNQLGSGIQRVGKANAEEILPERGITGLSESDKLDISQIEYAESLAKKSTPNPANEFLFGKSDEEVRNLIEGDSDLSQFPPEVKRGLIRLRNDFNKKNLDQEAFDKSSQLDSQIESAVLLKNSTSGLLGKLNKSSMSESFDKNRLGDVQKFLASSGGVPIDRARIDWISKHRDELGKMGLSEEDISTPSDFVDMLLNVPSDAEVASLRQQKIRYDSGGFASEELAKMQKKWSGGGGTEPVFTSADNPFESELQARENGLPDMMTAEFPDAPTNRSTPPPGLWDDGLDETPTVEQGGLSAEQIKKLQDEGVQGFLETAAAGIEDVPEKYAGRINLDRVAGGRGESSEPWTRKVYQLVYDRFVKNNPSDEQRRMSVQEMEEEARALGLDVKGVLGRKKGEVWNYAKSKAARNLLEGSIYSLRQKIGEINQKGGLAGMSDVDKATFLGEAVKTAAMYAEVQNNATQLGRALRQQQMLASAVRAGGEELQSVLSSLHGGRENADYLITKLMQIDPNNTAQIGRFLQKSFYAKTRDAIYEVWINGLLSGIKTHVVNTMSNTASILYRTGLEKPVAAGVEALMKGKNRERYFRETPQELYGMITGLKDAVQSFKDTWATEVPSGPTKVNEVANLPAIPGKVGKVIRIPSRLLQATDDFFKTLVYSGEIQARAYRKARNMGLKGDDFANKIAELTANPTKEMTTAAIREANYRTFTSPLGDFGKRVMSLRNQYVIGRIIVPFLRTPLNVATFALERTPGAGLAMMASKAKRGIYKGNREALTDDAAKQMVGASVGALVAMLAKGGLVTGGGPKEQSKREALYATGWKPYSFKIGDKYVPYGRLEPIGSLVGISADFAELADNKDVKEKDLSAAAQKISLAFARNITNKTFMTGLSNAIDAVSDPAMYGEKWISNLAGTVVPSAVAQFASATDDKLRQVSSPKDAIVARIPGASKSLPAKRDAFGREITRDGSPVDRLVNPIAASKEKGTPADKEIARLGAGVGKVKKTLTHNGKDIELTDKEHNYWQKLSGEKAKTAVDALVKTNTYKHMSDEDKVDAIREVITKARTRARTPMLSYLRKTRGKLR